MLFYMWCLKLSFRILSPVSVATFLGEPCPKQLFLVLDATNDFSELFPFHMGPKEKSQANIGLGFIGWSLVLGKEVTSVFPSLK